MDCGSGNVTAVGFCGGGRALDLSVSNPPEIIVPKRGVTLDHPDRCQLANHARSLGSSSSASVHSFKESFASLPIPSTLCTLDNSMEKRFPNYVLYRRLFPAFTDARPVGFNVCSPATNKSAWSALNGTIAGRAGLSGINLCESATRTGWVKHLPNSLGFTIKLKSVFTKKLFPCENK